jgi:putative transposase
LVRKTTRKGIPKEPHKQLTPEEQSAKEQRDGEIPFARMLQHRIRYFTDGAVIGSRIFVDEAFANSRSRFGPKRNSGARKMRGDASAAGTRLWSMRDLRKGIG